MSLPSIKYQEILLHHFHLPDWRHLALLNNTWFFLYHQISGTLPLVTGCRIILPSWRLETGTSLVTAILRFSWLNSLFHSNFSLICALWYRFSKRFRSRNSRQHVSWIWWGFIIWSRLAPISLTIFKGLHSVNFHVINFVYAFRCPHLWIYSCYVHDSRLFHFTFTSLSSTILRPHPHLMDCRIVGSWQSPGLIHTSLRFVLSRSWVRHVPTMIDYCTHTPHRGFGCTVPLGPLVLCLRYACNHEVPS